ncbi:DUF6053 domain-containing protein [Lysobacter enzymogenes]|uniref:DUF6053 domain-containing protein n=1 Tax=Lysobacter enzymogenes TaxID=69 RepID=UPI003CCD07C1
MGGTSVPMLLCRVAAIGAESVGTEVPPTTAVPAQQPPAPGLWISLRRRARPGSTARTAGSTAPGCSSATNR